MRTLMIPITVALTASFALPAAAQTYNPYTGAPGYEQRDARRDDRRDERDDRRDDRQDARRYAEVRHHDDRGNHYGQRKQAKADYRASSADWQNGRRYDWNRPDPRVNGYYPDRYYRSGSYYQPRYLAANERIYRGRDNQYYCRRSDGTTGLIIGAIGGGLLGDAIAPGGSKTVGTLAGGVLGAILGQSIDRGNQRIQCR